MLYKNETKKTALKKMYLLRFFVHILIFALILIPGFALEAKEKKPPKIHPCVTLQSRDFGMFTVFFDVLALLQCYEAKQFTYIEVNFLDTGLYYDKNYGLNWWEYYFQPIVLGTQTRSLRILTGLQAGVDPFHIEFHTPKEKVHEIIQKYITIKPDLQDEIDSFAAQHFEDAFIIGIHYRGTDKKLEAPRVAYEEVTKQLLKKIDSLTTDHYKIFVATDERAFLDYITSIFQDKVCWLKDVARSTNNISIHENIKGNRYLSGKYALMDCILLSKTNFLIRTSSNLSKASTFFNPSLEVVELNQRF